MNAEAVALYRRLAELPHKPCEMLSEPEAVALAEVARGRVCVEIGSWKGGSTAMLASTASLVVAIDPHRGVADTTGHTRGAPTIEWMRQTLEAAGVSHKVAIVPAPSHEACPLVIELGVEIDVLFVDGSHRTADVLSDLRQYANPWRWRMDQDIPGVRLIMDDLGYDSVREAFEEWRREDAATLRIRPLDLRRFGIEDPTHNRLHEGAVSKMTFFEVW